MVVAGLDAAAAQAAAAGRRARPGHAARCATRSPSTARATPLRAGGDRRVSARAAPARPAAAARPRRDRASPSRTDDPLVLDGRGAGGRRAVRRRRPGAPAGCSCIGRRDQRPHPGAAQPLRLGRGRPDHLAGPRAADHRPRDHASRRCWPASRSACACSPSPCSWARCSRTWTPTACRPRSPAWRPRSALTCALAARLMPTLERDARAIAETARLRGVALADGRWTAAGAPRRAARAAAARVEPGARASTWPRR